MQAVILAAGEGRRLRPLTLETPKPLLKIKGRPILEYIIENLPEQIEEVVLVVGYKAEQIKNHFGNKFGGRKFKYAHQDEPRGTFQALVCARKFLSKGPFLGLVGDDLYKKTDLENLVRHPNSVLVHETKTPERFGICKVDGNGFLAELVEKPDYDCGNLANTGAFVLDESIFDEPVLYGPNQEELLAPMIGSLARKKPIKVIKGSFWFPIGYQEDLKMAEKLMRYQYTNACE